MVSFSGKNDTGTDASTIWWKDDVKGQDEFAINTEKIYPPSADFNWVFLIRAFFAGLILPNQHSEIK